MFWLVVFSLLSTALLASFDGALVRLGKWESEIILRNGRLSFFYGLFTNVLFPFNAWEGFRYSLKSAKYAYRLLYGIAAFLFFAYGKLLHQFDLSITLKASVVILGIAFVTDFIFTLMAYKKPEYFIRFTSPFIFLFSVPILPFATVGFFIMRFVEPELFKIPVLTRKKVSQKIKQLIEESGLIEYLDSNDKKLIFSLVNFKDRIAREVMVPRINVFSLSADITLAEAAKSALNEGYSRIPIYKGKVDNIIGVLLYKDVLNIYARSHEDPGAALQLQATIEEYVKPILYTPETKKISQLLQEFKSKQTHLAIVVDEWGGTEGIVTIEDILEELVGEIADEYDTDEEIGYTPIPSGGWIVDAKMSINDIEQNLHVFIPQSPEYDTIGGYIFHKAGEIPLKGWKIHHKNFELEVISSGERAIEKIYIKPSKTS